MADTRDSRPTRSLRLLGRRHLDAEMDREIETHIAMRVEDLVRLGMTPEAARAEAERRFGDLGTARERLHEAARRRESALRQRDRMGALRWDLRFAVRQARRSPAFTALSIGTLALGLGVATTMFTLVERVLLRPLPFRDADRLVRLSGQDSLGNRVWTVSSADWQDWQRESKTLAASALHVSRRLSVSIGDTALRLSGTSATGRFFETIGTRFVAGRPFTEPEVQSGEQLVVVSEGFWRRTLGGGALPITGLRLNGAPLTVVGVVAAGGEYPEGTELWVPFRYGAESGTRNNINFRAVGRLRDGVSIEQAVAELSGIARGIRERDPRDRYAFGVQVMPLRNDIVGDAGHYLKLLLFSVMLVLLIVCANLGAATLARAGARAREMAVRTSLGAGRGRLVQQLLIEQLALASAAGVLGFGLAWLGLRVLIAGWGAQIPRAHEIHLDASVFAFAFVASLATGVLAGLAPAIVGSRTSLRQLIAAGGRGMVRSGGRLAGRLLVSGEIALALMLLSGAALLVRSFRTLLGRDLGFDPGVTAAEITLSTPRYFKDDTLRLVTWEALLGSLGSIPGVTAVGVANWVPLGYAGTGFIEVAGRNASNDGAGYRVVSEDYFRAIGIPLLSGRSLAATDGPGAARVVLVNRRMAEMYWPGENPIAKLVRASSMEGLNSIPAPWLTVVGVVGNVRQWGIDTDPMPEMYVSFRQAPLWTSSMTAIVRSTVPLARLAPLVKARIRSVDPQLAADIGTLSERLSAQLATRRLTMTLLVGFAVMSALLASLGVYGVLSYAVTERTRELAVRAALGARRWQQFALISGMAVRIVSLGAALGLIGAFWVSQAFRALLVDVTPPDPTSYAWALVVLAAVATAAVLVPAYRATQLDPMVALQAE